VDKKHALLAEIKAMDTVHKSMPCTDPMDAAREESNYVRYADDFIIGIMVFKGLTESEGGYS